ncbi:hypothetical protein FJT64_004368 [Amphibalanus amphitrite]|uniref:Uncharacterized protein n=1 Tax=Amphibalanus amphitrite TaxID=1232801 RepID=A0A6A4W8K8_AMPAM|nr:hypothetical protein FJT64_004368 [Amphibalanus amphitrite]
MSGMERLCALCFDEMPLNGGWCYDQMTNRAMSATKLQLLMVRGLCASWKQPCYYGMNSLRGVAADIVPRCVLLDVDRLLKAESSEPGIGRRRVSYHGLLGATNRAKKFVSHAERVLKKSVSRIGPYTRHMTVDIMSDNMPEATRRNYRYNLRSLLIRAGLLTRDQGLESYDFRHLLGSPENVEKGEGDGLLEASVSESESDGEDYHGPPTVDLTQLRPSPERPRRFMDHFHRLTEAEIREMAAQARARPSRAKKATLEQVPSGSSRRDAERSRPRWPLFDVMDVFLAHHTSQRRRPTRRQDCSNREQMALVVRFIDSRQGELVVREDPIGLVDVF